MFWGFLLLTGLAFVFAQLGAMSVWVSVLKMGLMLALLLLAVMGRIIVILWRKVKFVSNGQLYKIGRDIQAVQSTVNSVLELASAGAALSGLGFVTSLAGFAYMNHRLNKIDETLKKVLDEIKDIKNMLSFRNYAELRAAVDFMNHAEHANDRNTRHTKLSQANERFIELRYFYRDQWRQSKDTKVLPFLEDCYVLAFTGAAMTNSSLELYEIASKDYAEHYKGWSEIARTHIKQQLLNEDPRRLLHGVSSKSLPTQDLVELLDFVNDSDQGMKWVDELRGIPKNKPFPDMPWGGPSPSALRMARALTARNGALSATNEHMQYLAAKRISANRFAIEAEEERKKLNAPAVCISALSAAA
jgi:hypothetical protein